MKLGVAYNVFDGEENLEASVESIRAVADFICVVYQDVSNFGERRSVQPVLDLCKKLGIGATAHYQPGILKGAQAEVSKRNFGLEMCALRECTHMMTMDCDEIYEPRQIAMVKDDVRLHGYTTTVCQMLTYYKKPNIVLDPPEDYFVPLIYKIDERRFGARTFPVSADPTRRLETFEGAKFRKYERHEIQMHHYSMIRDDIRMKLRNSSAKVNFEHRIEEIAQYYDNYKDGEPAYFGGSEIRMLPVKVLP